MIYQFMGSCSESQYFQTDVVADSGHTFLDLHHALQSALGFQPEYLASFMIPVSKGHRKIEITQLDPGISKLGIYLMRNTLIGDIMTPEKKCVYYVFDLANDRSIKLQLTGTDMEKNLREPLITVNRGEIPVQAMDDVTGDFLNDTLETKSNDPNYGVVDDYYEIFGEKG